MFVAKNAWSALRRHPWRTVLTVVVSLVVALWSVFGTAVLHEYNHAHGAGYDQLKPIATFTPRDVNAMQEQGDNADSTKNYMTWNDYNVIGTAANEKNAQFRYTLVDSVPVRGGDLTPVSGAANADVGADETGGDFTLTSFLNAQAVEANTYGDYRIVDGEGLGYEDVTRHDVIISKALADKNGIKVGDKVTLGNAKDAKTTYTYNVCGLYAYTDKDGDAAAPFAKYVRDNVLYTTYYAFASDELDPLDASGWRRPDVDVVFLFDTVQQYDAFKAAVNDVTIPSGYHLSSPTIERYERSLRPLDALASTMRLTLILLWSIGGALLLALTLLAALPRREEIGFALQVGVTKGRLAWQFMNEILWPTLFGAALGLIIGCFTANPLAGNFVDGHLFTPDGRLIWNLIWTSAVSCLVLAAIAGIRVAAFPTAQLFASPYAAYDAHDTTADTTDAVADPTDTGTTADTTDANDTTDKEQA